MQDKKFFFILEGTSNGDQIRMWGLNQTTLEYEWLNVGTRSYITTLPAGTYYFIYKIGNDWYPGNASSQMEDGIKVIIDPCNCDDESFSYETTDNLDITFKYNHSEEAELTIVFTFSQVMNSDLNEEGKYVGADGKLYDVNNPDNQTVFTWTGPVSCLAEEAETFHFIHNADCGPSTAKDGNAIIWTDAKIVAVNGIALVDNELTLDIDESEIPLKGDLSSIIYKGCPITK